METSVPTETVKSTVTFPAFFLAGGGPRFRPRRTGYWASRTGTR